MNYFAHASSVIDEGATIGDNTKIWHFSHVMPKAIIGNDCMLAQNVFVADNAVIGNNVRIQNNVSIYAGVTLEDNVFCGPSCVFTNDITPRVEFSKKNNYKKTLVKTGASIGANVTITPGVTIGTYALIGAGSVVTKDVPDFALVYGNPAKVQGKVDKEGNRVN